MNSIKLTMRIEQDGNLISAFCPELNLRNHGETQEEAGTQLMKSIWLFMRVCHDKGTLFKVLEERGALHEERQADQTIQIPISDGLFSQSRPTVR